MKRNQRNEIPITKSTLDDFCSHGCQNPECKDPECSGNTLYLSARCHMRSELDISYTKDSGILMVTCRECGNIVAEVKVAEG